MPVANGVIQVSDDRARRLLIELQYAFGQMSASEIAVLVTVMPVMDFTGAVVRRSVNITKLAAAVAEHSYAEASQAVDAWRNDRLSVHLIEKARDVWEWGSMTTSQGVTRARAVIADPKSEGLKLMAVALAALASSGGIDGDGGLPDIDIQLFGIGAHRSPVTHSILIGAGVETLIALFIRLTLAVHDKLPKHHDPVWDQFSGHTTELLDAVSCGVSIGVAYHLLVDGLAQPAPYHGLPVVMPLQVHQAILAANGMTEGLDGVRRCVIRAKAPELVAEHRSMIGQTFEIDPTFIQWLGPDKFERLEQHGAWLLALSTGQLAPFTDAQVHFVEVAWQLAEARTEDEVAWVWFINLLRIAGGVQRATSTWWERFNLVPDKLRQ